MAILFALFCMAIYIGWPLFLALILFVIIQYFVNRRAEKRFMKHIDELSKTRSTINIPWDEIL